VGGWKGDAVAKGDSVGRGIDLLDNLTEEPLAVLEGERVDLAANPSGQNLETLQEVLFSRVLPVHFRETVEFKLGLLLPKTKRAEPWLEFGELQGPGLAGVHESLAFLLSCVEPFL
jgi:hypothetical protein